MSTTVLDSSVNILNAPMSLNGVDVITRDAFSSTIVGYNAALAVKRPKNSVFGYNAMKASKTAARNSVFGYGVAAKMVSGNDNCVFGNNAAANSTQGNDNVYIGSYTANYLEGDFNVLIGYSVSPCNNDITASSNVGIGALGIILGSGNVSVGTGNDIEGINSIALGSGIADFSYNSVLMGGNITNYGSNSFILNSVHNKGSNVFVNYKDDYLNIQDLIFAENSNGQNQITMCNDVVQLQSLYMGRPIRQGKENSLK